MGILEPVIKGLIWRACSDAPLGFTVVPNLPGLALKTLKLTAETRNRDMALVSHLACRCDFLIGEITERIRYPVAHAGTNRWLAELAFAKELVKILLMQLLKALWGGLLGKKNLWHLIWPILRIFAAFCLLTPSVLSNRLQVWVKKRFKSTSVSMPWSIPPALLVLWSVVWMFYDRPPTEDFQLDDFDFFHGNYYDDLPGVNFDDASISFPETILAPTASPVAFLAVPDVHHMTQDPLPQLVAVQNNVVPLIETHGDGQRSPDNPSSQATPSGTDTERTPTPQRGNPKKAGRFTCASCKTSFTRKDNLDRHVNKKTCRPRAESRVAAQSPVTELGAPPFPEGREKSRGVKRAREGTSVEEESESVDKELKKLRKMLDEERAGRRRAEEQVDKLLDIIKDLSKGRN